MKTILAVAALALSMNAMAEYSEQEQTYLTICGSIPQLKELFEVEGPVTKDDLKELIDQRAPILNVLKNGKKGLQDVIEEGSKTDVGGFAVLIVCGSITQIKAEIKANGCYDIKEDKVVRDNGGIAACTAVMEKINKKQK